METVTLATFHETSSAMPLKRKLEEAHIPAEIHDESTLDRLWFVRNPPIQARVKVPVRDYEEAVRLMHEWDHSENILRHAFRCPECGSSRIEYPQFTRKFFLPNLLGLLSAVGLLQREFYCEDCQFTWPLEGRRRSRLRPHMAPYYFIEGIAQEESGSEARGQPS